MISLTRRGARVRDAKPTAQPATRAEKALIALGIDARVVSSTLGDLAEELAERSECDGVARARLWWLREAVRSVPHLARYAITYSHRTRIILAATAAVLATAVVVARDGRTGLPTQILLDGPTLAGAFVLNDTRSAQIAAHIVDDRGHALPSSQLHYALRRGEGLAVSASGVVSCRSSTDAVVSASFESIVTSIPVACRIVRDLRTPRWLTLIAGADGGPLPFTAIGINGESVRQLRGAMRVDDSAIVTVDGGHVRPIRPGETTIEVEVARRTARTRVFVHALVDHFTDRTPNQPFVAVRVHAGPGGIQRIAVPVGAFWLTYVPRREGMTPPTLVGGGAIRCREAPDPEAERFAAGQRTQYCTSTSAGAAILVSASAAIDGALALDLEPGPRAAP